MHPDLLNQQFPGPSAGYQCHADGKGFAGTMAPRPQTLAGTLHMLSVHAWPCSPQQASRHNPPLQPEPRSTSCRSAHTCRCSPYPYCRAADTIIIKPLALRSENRYACCGDVGHLYPRDYVKPDSTATPSTSSILSEHASSTLARGSCASTILRMLIPCNILRHSEVHCVHPVGMLKIGDTCKCCLAKTKWQGKGVS